MRTNSILDLNERSVQFGCRDHAGERVASKGVRLGNWLSIRQAQTLLNAPDATTTKGLRDRAILAVLLGCGLRRSEVAALTVPHVQQRDGRWCIVTSLASMAACGRSRCRRG